MSRTWLGFAAWSTAAAAGIGFAGQALAAPGNAGAVWVGTLASLLGALAGSLPLAAELDKPSGKPAAAIGKATLLRLAVTLAGGLLAVFSGVAASVDRRTLLFSLAASYLALLAVETGWFLKQARKERSTS